MVGTFGTFPMQQDGVPDADMLRECRIARLQSMDVSTVEGDAVLCDAIPVVVGQSEAGLRRVSAVRSRADDPSQDTAPRMCHDPGPRVIPQRLLAEVSSSNQRPLPSE